MVTALHAVVLISMTVRRALNVFFFVCLFVFMIQEENKIYTCVHSLMLVLVVDHSSYLVILLQVRGKSPSKVQNISSPNTLPVYRCNREWL